MAQRCVRGGPKKPNKVVSGFTFRVESIHSQMMLSGTHLRGEKLLQLRDGLLPVNRDGEMNWLVAVFIEQWRHRRQRHACAQRCVGFLYVEHELRLNLVNESLLLAEEAIVLLLCTMYDYYRVTLWDIRKQER